MQIAHRTLDVLEAILKLKGDFSLKELAGATGLNIHTVRRFVATFVERGYLYQKRKGGNYHIGFQLLQFYDTVDTAAMMKKRVFPFLEKLGLDIHATVHMAMLDGANAITIAVVPVKGILFQVLPDEGSKFPLHATSLGKVLLAHLPEKEIGKIVDAIPLTAFTDKTLKDKRDLKREIKTIKRDGIAFDDEEYEIGVRGAAAPIRGENGNVIAGIGFLGASFRVSSTKMMKLALKVKDTALEISRSLGYKGD